jgi:hypothetical protein
MLSQVAEWAGAAVAAGVVAGLVVLAAGAAGMWLLYRRVRRRLEGATAAAARYALQNSVGAVAGGRRVRLPPRVVHDLRRRVNGPPEVW